MTRVSTFCFPFSVYDIGLLFQSLNTTVRYYLAWSVAVFSIKYVLKGQYVKFILLIYSTATIHKSVLLVIPVYILAALPGNAGSLRRWRYLPPAVWCFRSSIRG